MASHGQEESREGCAELVLAVVGTTERFGWPVVTAAVSGFKDIDDLSNGCNVVMSCWCERASVMKSLCSFCTCSTRLWTVLASSLKREETVNNYSSTLSTYS